MTAEILNVKGIEIRVIKSMEDDFISLTDMVRARDGDFFVSDWLRNRNTLEFLGIWESINNPDFNYGEFAIIRNQSGLNRYKISAKEWITKTGAIGIKAQAGKYGGTYAHKDIAFEFGMWISPEFKIYLIKEFQRLKESEQQALQWTAKRELAKVNYRLHTDTIKKNLIIPELSQHQISLVYASEADMLNVCIFGMTAGEWRLKNPDIKGNMRDYANIEQLVVLANLESYNSIMIDQGKSQSERMILLNNVARKQLESIISVKIDSEKILGISHKVD